MNEHQQWVIDQIRAGDFFNNLTGVIPTFASCLKEQPDAFLNAIGELEVNSPEGAAQIRSFLYNLIQLNSGLLEIETELPASETDLSTSHLKAMSSLRSMTLQASCLGGVFQTVHGGLLEDFMILVKYGENEWENLFAAIDLYSETNAKEAAEIRVIAARRMYQACDSSCFQDLKSNFIEWFSYFFESQLLSSTNPNSEERGSIATYDAKSLDELLLSNPFCVAIWGTDPYDYFPERTQIRDHLLTKQDSVIDDVLCLFAKLKTKKPLDESNAIGIIEQMAAVDRWRCPLTYKL